MLMLEQYLCMYNVHVIKFLLYILNLFWTFLFQSDSSRIHLCIDRGGGANRKVPDMYGVGGVFGTQNTKVTCTLLYNKGGCPYFIPNHKSINGTFLHTFHNKIIKNYEKMTNFYTNFYIFFNELLL